MEIKKRKTFIAIGMLMIAVLVLLDQFTKHLAVLYLKNQPNIIWIKGVMELEYLENRGAAFGILQNQQWLFILLFFVFVTAVIFFYCRMPMDRKYLPVQIISLFLIAGGLGNLIDRIRLGYVIDFFYFSLIHFPIFNVADIYVTVSMVILFVLLIFYYKEEDFDLLFSFTAKKEKK
ncbi:MAG: signal peptidase II [Eubacteriales bacterium]|nr:signal peptidase II [Eubacteriales bacterium]